MIRHFVQNVFKFAGNGRLVLQQGQRSAIVWGSNNHRSRWHLLVVSIAAVPTSFACCAFIRRSLLKMEAKSVDSVLKECDSLYVQHKMAEAYDVLVAYKDSRNVEILWRLARMTYKRDEHTSSEKKAAAIKEALEILDACQQIDPNHADVHKWRAILIGSKENHPSIKEKIEEAFVIRENLERALELKPNDAYIHHVLGKWCYDVANIPWYQRKAAAMLFSTLPSATVEEALDHFQSAEKLNPNIFSSNSLMIARCLIDLNRIEEAGPYLRKCVADKSDNAETRKTAAEAEQFMKKYRIS